MSVNSRLKATKIIGKGKAFYRQKIPEPSCARKETVDIDILVTKGPLKPMNCPLHFAILLNKQVHREPCRYDKSGGKFLLCKIISALFFTPITII